MITNPRTSNPHARLPYRAETFKCACGKTGEKLAPNQKHCSEACKREAARKRAAARHRRLNRGHHGRMQA